MTKITWLGHASWQIETDQHKILLDPFLTDNPSATKEIDDFRDCTHLLISHGHFDHIADAPQIASQSDATVVAIFEIAQWFSEKHGIANTVGMNVGGEAQLPFGIVKMTPALHSNSLPDGSPSGLAAGFLLTIAGQRIYFACDTAIFGDMAYYTSGADVAILPIGDLFTMGVQDSIEAINLIKPNKVLPTHYNTWPPIEVDPHQWAERVREDTAAEPVILKVNESLQIS